MTVLLESFRFSVSCHLQIVKALLLYQFECLLFLFFCLIAEARTSSMLLNKCVDRGHPCLIPDLRGKVLSFSPLRMMLAVGFSYMAFIMLRYVLFKPTLLRIFYHEWMLYFVKCFFCR